MTSISIRSNLRAMNLMFAGLILAIVGQVFTERHSLGPGVVLYSGALGLWIAGLVMGSREPPTAATFEGIQASDNVQIQRLPLLAALLLAVVTFLISTDNTLTVTNVTTWVLSIIALLYAAWERNTARPWLGQIAQRLANISESGFQIRWQTLVLAAVVLLGMFFYYYHLDQLPGEMTSDHAEKILDVNDILDGKHPIFFTRNTGREPLEFYLVAAFVSVTGHRLDHMALKWITATIGLLAVPLTFFLAREIFDELVGWLAAAFVAISLWPIGIARMGLRFPFTPFFSALAFIFFFRALKYQRRNDFLLLGLVLGAGLYGYHAFKIVPLIVAACFALWLLMQGRRGVCWESVRTNVINFSLTVLLALIVFMPFLRFMVENPENFWYRVLTRLSSEEQPIEGNPLLIFADNVKNAILMFNVQGDHSWPNTLSEVPVLDVFAGGLFVLGLSYALYHLWRYRETRYAYVLLALLGLLLPSALAIAFPIENPSVVRAGGAIPFVFIIVALPLARLGRGLKNVFNSSAVAAAVLVAVVLASAQVNYNRYFIQFDQQYRQNSWNSSEIAGAIHSFADTVGSLDHAWVVAFPYWVDTRNVAINLGAIQWNNVVWHVKEMPDASNDPEPRLYILSPSDSENLDDLANIFPNGQARVYHGKTPGREFVMFFVPGKVPPEAEQKLGQ